METEKAIVDKKEKIGIYYVKGRDGVLRGPYENTAVQSKLPKWLWIKLKTKKQKDGISESQMIIEALKVYLSK